jgi:hypothetical protein
MKHTPPTPEPSQSTSGEMLEELIDLTTGFGVAFMPALLLAMPGIVLCVVLPAILLVALAAPLAVIGAVIAGPFLLARRLRRRPRRPDRPRPAPQVPVAPRASHGTGVVSPTMRRSWSRS